MCGSHLLLHLKVFTSLTQENCLMGGSPQQKDTVRHPGRKEEPHAPRLPAAPMLLCWQWPKHPRKSAPRRNTLDHYPVIRFCMTIKSATKKTEEDNTPVSTTGQKPYDTDMAKVNTLMKPDGEKKA
ncbi:60S ribosomal protein L23a [Camelus dromedarius]|uniref:60S ribosomal protein L23a n=1 Tax=Camelus dromedarius TaxID=9838 RepID=A0A5N4EE10_CAMDR|nr:60S ribosomal protein L23a [Camelus dromedarius]